MRFPRIVCLAWLLAALCTRAVDAAEPPSGSAFDRFLLPRVELQNATLSESLDALRKAVTEIQPHGKLLLFRLHQASAASRSDAVRVNLSLRNIPLSEALQCVAFFGGLRLRMEGDVALLETPPPPSARVEARLALKPGAFARLFGPGENLLNALVKCGIFTEPDSAASYSAEKNELSVRGTEASIEMMRALVSAVAEKPAGVRAVGAKEIARNPLEAINQKLNKVIVPGVSLAQATPLEALAFLRRQADELDSKSPAALRGVNLVLVPPRAPAEHPAPAPNALTVTLKLNPAPLMVCLGELAPLLDMKLAVLPHAVVLMPIGTPSTVIETGEFAADALPIAATSKLTDARSFLMQQGVGFSESAAAIYLKESRRLVVGQTRENLDLIEVILASLRPEKTPQKR